MIYRFADPHWLWLLLLIPLLLWLQGRKGRAAALRFSSTAIAAQVAASLRRRPGRWLPRLRWAALACLILAMARPQTGEEIRRTVNSGVDMIIALDLSTSMWAHDFELNGVPIDRLSVLRMLMEEFVNARRHDRLGLIAFAAVPYLVSPLTLNHDFLLRRLNELQLGGIEDGTAIGSAIGSATNRLRELDAQSRILILLTDGANNRGQLDPIMAAEAAKALGIKIYTIGVGRTGMVPYPVQFDRSGKPVRDRNGNVILRALPSDIDLNTLERIAEITGGRYFHATDTKGFREIYAEIDRLEKRDVEMEVRHRYAEAFHYPLAVALCLLALEWLLAFTFYRRLPQ